ncbi:hypothetical protein IEQ_05017 [Bacillus cereus BAG6X1-2]|nr:hypothetical protein IEQ_05017 [Bacillus cereus BAG6X1-2]
MGKDKAAIGETLVFRCRTIENKVSEIVGKIVSFGITNDGIEYWEVDVGVKRNKKYVI